MPVSPRTRDANRPPNLNDLASVANEAHKCGEGSARNSLTHFRMAGEALIEAKRQVGHGGWVKWIKANVVFNRRTASRYMQLADNWDTVSQTEGLRDALDLLSNGKRSRLARVYRAAARAKAEDPNSGLTCWQRAVWLGLVGKVQKVEEAEGVRYDLRATVTVTTDTDPRELEELIRTGQVHWVLRNERDKTLAVVRVETVESLEPIP